MIIIQQEMNQKKLFNLLFAALFFICCVNEVKIEGKWYVDKSQNENGRLKKSINKWIEFYSNGTLIGGKKEGSEIKKGIWKFDSTNNKLIIDSKNRYGGEGIYTLEKLSQNEMILANDTIKVFFKK